MIWDPHLVELVQKEGQEYYGAHNNMNIVLSVLVLATFGFLLGALMIWRRGGAKKQAVLMVILALVSAANVGIWTIPDKNGETPLLQVEGESGR